MPLSLALSASGLRLTVTDGADASFPSSPPPPPPAGMFLADELGNMLLTELGDPIVVEAPT
jgi:hypothetical protein